MYDVIIIGGGITGCMLLRELSRYKLKLLLLEKQNDLASGATMANSAIIHAGFDPKPGSLKARFNVRGSLMYEDICKELDVLYRKTPSLVVAFSPEEVHTVEMLLQRGKSYGVPGLDVVSREKLRELEPNMVESAECALYAPSSMIVEPWGLSIAAAENAADNGAELRMNERVTAIVASNGGFTVRTGSGSFSCHVVINAAGVHADTIHNMIAPESFKILPRKGHYYVMDNALGDIVKNVFFPCPTEKGKGILITPEIHGKVMLGPDSEYCPDPDDDGTEESGLRRVRETAAQYLKLPLPMRLAIRSFSGLRPTPDTGDFIIEENAYIKGFFDVAGIESPGLASAPAIAEYVRELVFERIGIPEKKEDFNPVRRPQVRFAKLPSEEQRRLAAENPAYARIVCKCERITEAEIVDAINRNAGARSIKAVKKRAGAGYGRCQGGFCQPNVLEILARELKLDKNEVLYDGPGSNILLERTK